MFRIKYWFTKYSFYIVCKTTHAVKIAFSIQLKREMLAYKMHAFGSVYTADILNSAFIISFHLQVCSNGTAVFFL